MGREGDAVNWFPYGWHANPPNTSLAVLMSMQSRGEGRVAFPGSPLERPYPWAVGECGVYHPETGTKVHCRADGSLDVESTSDAVNITASGDVVVNGSDCVVNAANVDINANANVTIDGGSSVQIAATVISLTGIVTVNGTFICDGDAFFTTNISSNSVNIGDQHKHGGVDRSDQFTDPVAP